MMLKIPDAYKRISIFIIIVILLVLVNKYFDNDNFLIIFSLIMFWHLLSNLPLIKKIYKSRIYFKSENENSYKNRIKLTGLIFILLSILYYFLDNPFGLNEEINDSVIIVLSGFGITDLILGFFHVESQYIAIKDNKIEISNKGRLLSVFKRIREFKVSKNVILIENKKNKITIDKIDLNTAQIIEIKEKLNIFKEKIDDKASKNQLIQEKLKKESKERFKKVFKS